MSYHLRILKKARADMEKSAKWYEKEQVGLGDRFVRQVVRSFKLIETGPLHYEEKFSKRFRFAPVEKFPFLIVFKIRKNEIIINAVFHTSREPKNFV